MMKSPLRSGLLALTLAMALQASHAQQTSVTVQADAPGKPISPDLFGIFFEDINYSADGGLYAEQIQNRSFEYQATEQPSWNSLSFWELTKRGDGEGNWAVEDANPLHTNNPHYVVLSVGKKAGEGVGLMNPGFDGIPVKAGETYDVSFFARQLVGEAMPVTVRLESKEGDVLGEASLEVSGTEWKRFSAAIIASHSNPTARFVLLAKAPGRIALDEVSLFPRKTFHDRPNGLRPDLAQAIADLHPKFIRFPGGCLTHGDGLNNIYRWKETIGPIEQRKGKSNIWRYHQSVGLGYFEYFQFCEDIGAKPLPVIAAAVSCQNSDLTHETGQQCLPMEDMPAYIQDVLDLIEWANGPASSKWGAKRAAAGHPEPFHLEYLGIGNEDKITPGFKERFTMICEAVKKAHPEITIIGTAGPRPDGSDFVAGRQIAGELKIPIVDEHYYEKPEWFLENLNRYNDYDRTKPQVYVGEYASHGNTLFNALSEAAYMTSLERNGDIVHLASYAPLLAKNGHTQWKPDLIYFTNEGVFPSINYHVQQMFAQNSGDLFLPTTATPSAKDLAASTVRDSKSGDLILKFVNTAPTPKPLHVTLQGIKNPVSPAALTVLSGNDPKAVDAQSLAPKVTTTPIAPTFDYEAPANSLTVIRIKVRP